MIPTTRSGRQEGALLGDPHTAILKDAFSLSTQPHKVELHTKQERWLLRVYSVPETTNVFITQASSGSTTHPSKNGGSLHRDLC